MPNYSSISRHKKSEILLIEDDLALGESLVEVLQLNNFNVQWCTDGKQAVEYLNKYIPEIILSDLMMPIMTGDAFLVHIRKHKKYNTIPFIMITANIDDGIKYKQLENGVNDYITKPFNVRELVAKIKNLLVFKKNIEKKYKPDIYAKITIKLSQKDFLTSVNEYIADNLKSKISIDDLANFLCTSRSTLDKRIRKHSKKNVSQYVREFKLDYAIKLIDLGESNIQFLADETGFNSLSYFSTSFKTYTGLNPRDYFKSTSIS